MNKYDKIIILGFRCVGKTTISKELSNILKLNLIDMDSYIEQKENKTINEISDNGKNWKYFREIETDTLKEVLKLENVIISAGGGVGVNNIIYNEKLTYGEIQRELIINTNNTLKILLESSEEVIRKRLYISKINDNNRPDLANITTNINEYIDNNIAMMKDREENYKKMADIIFNTDNEDVKVNVNNLMKMII